MAATLLLSGSERKDGGRMTAENSVSRKTTDGERHSRGSERCDYYTVHCLSPNSSCFISPAGMCLVLSVLFQHAKLFVYV